MLVNNSLKVLIKKFKKKKVFKADFIDSISDVII